MGFRVQTSLTWLSKPSGSATGATTAGTGALLILSDASVAFVTVSSELRLAGMCSTGCSCVTAAVAVLGVIGAATVLVLGSGWGAALAAGDCV